MKFGFLYRGGGDFNVGYAERLVKSLRKRMPTCTIVGLIEETQTWKCDEDIDIEHVLFPEWGRRLSKLEFLRTVFDCYKPFVYLDLDTLVTRDLSHWDHLLNPEKFAMIRDLWHPENPESGLMWVAGDTREAWRKVRKGESEFPEYWESWTDAPIIASAVGEYDFIQDLVGPLSVTSAKTKAGVKKEKPLHDVICFHGNPRPAEAAVYTPWVAEEWNNG